MSELMADRCPFADDHPAIEVRLKALEDEVTRLRNATAEQNARWDAFLVQFGEVKAKIENINGRMAGYLMAGGLLAAIVSAVANHVWK